MENSRVTLNAFLVCLEIFLLILIVLSGFLLNSSFVSAVSTQKNSFFDTSSSVSSNQGIGMRNPAAVYCVDVMEYGYKKIKTDVGEKGICVMPDGKECEEWSFLNGKCGKEYSYCEKNGLKSKIVNDGKNPLSRDYVVCLSRDKRAKKIGSVVDLTRLLERSSVGSEKLGESDIREKGELSSLGVVDEPIPISFDWRNKDEKNWMTPVKDQGTCGACWAFTAVGAVEAQYNIVRNDADLDLDLDLSEQYLISDCFGDGNCAGGSAIIALNFFTTDGVPDEECYPFVDKDSVCSDRCVDWSNRLWKITGHEQVPKNREGIKNWLVNRGVISSALNIGPLYWDGDILRCDPDLLHPPTHTWVIVGYNETGEYWVVKNSWGLGWGESGYGKLGYGECFAEKYAEGVNICECDEWRDDGCGKGVCGINEMRQVRTCSIEGCDVEERCVENLEVCTDTGFIRGKVNNDDAIDLGDAVFILDYVFAEGEVPACLDSADANDDGAIDIGDVVYLLAYLFVQGPEPAKPFEVAGVDLTEDELGC